MLARFERARVIDVGDWEIDGTKYPWVDLVQRRQDLAIGAPDRDSSGVERFGVSLPHGDVLPALEFGLFVSGWLETSEQTKVVRGTDRALTQTKARIVALSIEPSSSNGVPAVDPEAVVA
jgi:hypothetical protein